jgi:hypothetical protein
LCKLTLVHILNLTPCFLSVQYIITIVQFAKLIIIHSLLLLLLFYGYTLLQNYEFKGMLLALNANSYADTYQYIEIFIHLIIKFNDNTKF